MEVLFYGPAGCTDPKVCVCPLGPVPMQQTDRSLFLDSKAYNPHESPLRTERCPKDKQVYREVWSSNLFLRFFEKERGCMASCKWHHTVAV